MASHQETIFGKYFAAGAKGGGAGLELPPYAAEHTEMLYNKARGRPLGYMFDVAQAFVYQVHLYIHRRALCQYYDELSRFCAGLKEVSKRFFFLLFYAALLLHMLYCASVVRRML